MKMAQGECLLCAVAMPGGLIFTLHYPVVPRGSYFSMLMCAAATVNRLCIRCKDGENQHEVTGNTPLLCSGVQICDYRSLMCTEKSFPPDDDLLRVNGRYCH